MIPFLQAKYFCRTRVDSGGITEEEGDDEYYFEDNIIFVMKKRANEEVYFNIF